MNIFSLLGLDTWAGSFMYHYGTNLVSFGYVVGLDYQNPYVRCVVNSSYLLIDQSLPRIPIVETPSFDATLL